MAKRLVDETSLTTVANAIREKTGESDPLVFPEDFVTAIEGISTGGSGGSSDDFEWIKDGNTHIWISLTEGRTSPMLGVCPNGTVTVDWGDGTTPDVLTGTSVTSVKWTPTHNYASAGDYIITLTVDGKMGVYGTNGGYQNSGILRYSNDSDSRNEAYRGSVRHVELGQSVTYIGNYSFKSCYSLSNVFIPEGVTYIGNAAFEHCYSLSNVVIHEGVTSIKEYVFNQCYSLSNVVIPEGVISIDRHSFDYCRSLSNVVIPESVTSIGSAAFSGCVSLSNVVIPEGLTSIGGEVFNECSSFASVVIPKSVTSIGGGAFAYCRSMAFCDFSTHTSVPTLSDSAVFKNTPSDFEIRVPAALYDEWVAATNWSTYVDYIVAV